jgi:hypothetical protein
VNKYVTSFCFFEPKSTAKGLTAPSFVIELDGRYYRNGLLKSDEDMKLPRGLVQLHDDAVTEESDGRMFVYISKVSI